MSLSEAIEHLRHWPDIRFGDVFPFVAEADRDALKHAFVYRTQAAQPAPRALPPATNGGGAVARVQGYEGSPCEQCGAMKVVRNGACLLCRECGATTGCS